ncbi:MAG TPA: hypothetical protein PKK43_12570 [Spirochaetota bacterium]|nr:hypothetical protein [Spirochaetota bacterium]
MMQKKEAMSYDCICFNCLAYEFDPTKLKETERKIKSRLRYRGAGPYDQARVEYIRRFRDDLYREFAAPAESKYYSKTDSEFSSPDDFNIEMMTEDYSCIYNLIDAGGMRQMILFAAYLYYLR